MAAELELIGTRQLRDHVTLGLEFDYVQLAGQTAPGEKEAWNADALMEGARVGTGRAICLAALEDRVKAEEMQWAPLLQLHFPDKLGDYLHKVLVETGQRFFKKEPMDARLCRLGNEKAGATHAMVGREEGHRRGSSPGAGRVGTFGGASAEGLSSRGTAGEHISNSQGNPASPTATEAVLPWRGAPAGLGETRPSGCFQM